MTSTALMDKGIEELKRGSDLENAGKITEAISAYK